MSSQNAVSMRQTVFGKLKPAINIAADEILHEDPKKALNYWSSPNMKQFRDRPTNNTGMIIDRR
jgi:hypothetical protein